MRGRKPKYFYNDKIADRIFGLIVEGRSIEAACREPGIPSRWVLDRWRLLYPEFNKLILESQEFRREWHYEVLYGLILDGNFKSRQISYHKWAAQYRGSGAFGKNRRHYATLTILVLIKFHIGHGAKLNLELQAE